MLIENPSNSLEWMIFLAQKYASMFIKGTWLTLEIFLVCCRLLCQNSIHQLIHFGFIIPANGIHRILDFIS
jgi:hypothetical protein